MHDRQDTHREQADDDVTAHMLAGSLNVNETVVEEDDEADTKTTVEDDDQAD
jgi:hypothetical protein